MISDADIQVFVYDPKEFIQFCEKVVNRIVLEYQDDNHQELATQLDALKHAMRQMERRGAPIPDSIQIEYDRLEQRLRDSEASQTIADLRDGLRAIANDLNRQTVVAAPTPRQPRGQAATPQADLKPVLVESLRELGGSAPCNDVLALMERKLAGRLLPGDHEPDARHVERWRHNAHWARLQLVQEGVIKENSSRGWWQLVRGR
ncbi:MAG: hypothetical protein GXY07_20395 [Candidatus Hydrogenedentes bacterium]|nr:hypothetical protein [Candidatus Hydrogenedentota bacterium]